MLEDFFVDYFNHKVKVFYNFFVLFLKKLLFLVVFFHLCIMSTLCFVLLLAFCCLLLLINLLLRKLRLRWLERWLRFFNLLVESKRPLVFKFSLNKIVLDLHFYCVIVLEVSQNLVEEFVSNLVYSHVEISHTALCFALTLMSHAS